MRNKRDPIKAVPRPSLRRLPEYLQLLREFRYDGREQVSCTQLALALRQDPTQVRKDLSFTGIVGKPRVGYRVSELISAIETFLGWDSCTDAFLIGVGNLGRAVLGYRGFKDCGLNIVAAFDVDPLKVGTQLHGRPVLPPTKLVETARRLGVRIGVITVPAPAAQMVADLLVQGGVKAIWNFAPVRLHVPDEIIVENELLAAGLAVISRRLRLCGE